MLDTRTVLMQPERLIPGLVKSATTLKPRLSLVAGALKLNLVWQYNKEKAVLTKADNGRRKDDPRYKASYEWPWLQMTRTAWLSMKWTIPSSSKIREDLQTLLDDPRFATRLQQVLDDVRRLHHSAPTFKPEAASLLQRIRSAKEAKAPTTEWPWSDTIVCAESGISNKHIHTSQGLSCRFPPDHVPLNATLEPPSILDFDSLEPHLNAAHFDRYRDVLAEVLRCKHHVRPEAPELNAFIRAYSGWLSISV